MADKSIFTFVSCNNRSFYPYITRPLYCEYKGKTLYQHLRRPEKILFSMKITNL